MGPLHVKENLPDTGLLHVGEGVRFTAYFLVL